MLCIHGDLEKLREKNGASFSSLCNNLKKHCPCLSVLFAKNYLDWVYFLTSFVCEKERINIYSL